MLRFFTTVVVLSLAASCQSRADAAIRAGNAAAASGRLDDARARFEEAIEARADDPKAHALLGNTLYALGKPGEAAAEWAKAGSEAAAIIGLARLDLEARDAGACLDRLSALQPEHDVRLLRARALVARGTNDDAQAAIATLEGVDAPDAVFLRASALVVLRHFAEAQAALSGIERSSPALASYGLARVAAAQGRPTDALVYLSAAKLASGTTWNAAAVALDPAFEFLREREDFLTLTRP